MERYIRVYRRILELNAETLVAYRSNLVNSIVSSLSWGIFSFLSMFLLTGRVSSVLGWSRDEILLLTGLYSMFIGFFHTFFTRNFERLAVIIDRGNLDAVLLLPIDSQIFLSVRYVSYTSLIRIVLGFAFSVYMVNRIGLAVTPFMVAECFVFLAAGTMILYSIWFLVSTLLIFNPLLSNLIVLMFSVSNMARYPGEIYRQLGTYLFVFLMPLTFIIVSPAKVLLGKAGIWDIAGLFLFAVALTTASRIFWAWALRHYGSVSS
jgi:ABC-2 type transport system permease protein